jgi:hypothetical protein
MPPSVAARPDRLALGYSRGPENFWLRGRSCVEWPRQGCAASDAAPEKTWCDVSSRDYGMVLRGRLGGLGKRVRDAPSFQLAPKEVSPDAPTNARATGSGTRCVEHGAKTGCITC